MRHVEFDPMKLVGDDKAWWDAWYPRAEAARAEVIDCVKRGEEPKFKQPIWADLKRFLLNRVFANKCAYCEATVTAVSVGDAEHYRPKGKVTLGRKPKPHDPARIGATTREHPGYYWLAYSWQNLVPSCELCNANNGKLNQFPIAGTYVADPTLASTDLDQQERPLLLHPYFDTPGTHLVFGDFGAIEARDGSPKGEESIRVYDLKREELNRERQRAQERAQMQIMMMIGAARGVPAIQAAFRAAVAPYENGTEPFSQAALACIHGVIQAMNR